jgi:hypothetical protein
VIASSYRFYFAYLGASEAYSATAHARDDEHIFSLSVDQEEGEAAGATVGITYREGSYIALGRRAAISCRKVDQDTGAFTGPVIPLIVGRITAAPIGLVGEVVELEILAKVDDWETRRADLIAPISENIAAFDPIFYEPAAATDPADVLAASCSIVAWDRITGLPRISSLVDGPRTLELGSIARDNIDRSVETPPLRSVTLELTATWQQDASVRSTVQWRHGKMLDVVANQACQQAWPKPGTDIGGDWIVEESALAFGQPRFVELGEIAGNYDSAIYSGDVPVYRATTARVVLRNNRKQARTEVIRITASADVQELMAPATEVKTFALRQIIGSGDDPDPWQALSSYEAGDVVFYAKKLWSCRTAHTATYAFAPSLWSELDSEAGRIEASFFQTSRGVQAIRYATKLAAAILRKRARAVVYTFSAPLEDVIDIAIDDMITINTPVIASGSATGKVTRYQLNGGGWAEIEIACSVGRGGFQDLSVPAISGTAPKLGPSTYPATGRVTPLAQAQIAALREAPDAYSLDVTVEIDAPAVPATYELRRQVSLDAGTMSISRGVTVE